MRTHHRGSTFRERMVLAVADLTPDETRAISRALRRPVGHYSADRAAQLSGVPRSTLYGWASNGYFVPDYEDWEPKQWSYRDLVLARLFAWIRGRGMPASTTSMEIASIRSRLADRSLDPTVGLRATKHGVYPEGVDTDDLTGAIAIPSVLDVLQTFNLVEPIDESIGEMWGPSLVRPSSWTAISPDVFAGEPTIRATRIPTASLYALQEDRGLSVRDMVDLYPGLSSEQVADGLDLERRVRGLVAV